MAEDKDKESHEEIVEHEEVSADTHKDAASQEAEAHHGHPPAGHSEHHDEEIVWHQEKLLGTMLIGALFSVIALFGLAQAGKTPIDIKMGESAYNQVQQAKPDLSELSSSHGKTHGNSEEHGKTDKHVSEEETKNSEHAGEAKETVHEEENHEASHETEDTHEH